MMDIDSVLGKLGQYGRFQIIVYIFCGIQGVGFTIWDMLTVTSFLGPTSDFQCIVLEENVHGSETYITYNNSVNHGACEDGELIFDLETYGRTMVTEWGLVGDKAMLVKLSQSLFMGAMMIGSLVLGQLSDSFGRKPCFAISLALTAFLGLASGFAPNIWVFIALRILTGFVCPGYSLAAFVLSMELFPPKSRAAAGIITGCFSAAGFVPLAVMAYFIRDWRYLQITTSAFRCLVLPLLFLMPESVQWLASKGRHEELEKLLQRIAKFNGVDIPFPILPITTDSCTSPDEPSVYDKADTSKDYLSKDKSMEKLFMYDSALSLDRDYIPPEDGVSLEAYSSESEAEEADEPQTTSYQFKGETQMFSNLPFVNSSISILSELNKEQCELLCSVDSLRIEKAPSKTHTIVPMNRPLRKKSVSLCQLPNIQVARTDQCHRQYDLPKIASIPNLSVDPTPAKDIPSVIGKPKTKVNPANCIMPSEERYDSLFFLSIPTLAMSFGGSQNLSTNVVPQYNATLQDDDRGCDSSTSDSSPVSGYDTMEEGYCTELSQTNGYSELPVFSEPDEPVKTKMEKKSYNCLDLFRKSSVRQISFASMCLWCATYVVYMGLSMSTDALAGDPYINFSLVGLVEIPAVVIAVVSAVRIGRRFPSGVLQIMALLSCCVYLVLPTENDTAATATLSVVAILLAKTFISAAYCIQCMFTAEILPTPLSSAFAMLNADHSIGHEGRVSSPSGVWKKTQGYICGILAASVYLEADETSHLGRRDITSRETRHHI